METERVNEYETGASDERPWGKWTVLAAGDGYVVKEIEVKPGEILSLQSHDHRAEHWIITEGEAEVTLGDEVLVRRANETVFIPVGTRHRITNSGTSRMRFIEVQTGDVLSEDDIQRYEDRYGRSG